MNPAETRRFLSNVDLSGKNIGCENLRPNSVATSDQENPRWFYDAFLSYSTAADYKLAVRLEVFLEGFHNEPGIRQHSFAALKICADGSDFSLPRRKGLANAPNEQLDRIKDIIRPYLERSASLVVLWPGRIGATPFMDWELQEFLGQNDRFGWDRPVRIAVTRGEEPGAEQCQCSFYSKISANLHEESFYDFRAQNPAAQAWRKVRDFERQRLRLAVDLRGPIDPSGRPFAVDDLIPGWRREQLRIERRRRNIARLMAISFSILALAASGFAAYALSKRNEAWSRQLAAQAELLRNEGPRRTVEAIVVAAESLRRRPALEPDLTERRGLSAWHLVWETKLPSRVTAIAYASHGNDLCALSSTLPAGTSGRVFFTNSKLQPAKESGSLRVQLRCGILPMWPAAVTWFLQRSAEAGQCCGTRIPAHLSFGHRNPMNIFPFDSTQTECEH